MTGLLRSALWHRVAAVRPRLRAGVRVRRHLHRDQAWYQLIDEASGRSLRIDSAGYRFLGHLDGRRTTDEVWQALYEGDGERVLTQDDAIRVMGQLSSAGFLQCDLTPDLERLFRQHRRRVRSKRWTELNPLAVRARLFNPSRLLEPLDPWLKRIFHPAAFAGWLAVVLLGLAFAGLHWTELVAEAAARLDSPRMLLIAWVVYPLLKALHEAGHALAVRRWGGAVNEVGFTLFVIVPVPYVDASAASAFPRRSQRATVSAIGIMVELFAAALALAVWLHVEPGVARDVALAVMLIGAVSTLAFNGNPLLRFDGYHLMCDLLDLPNLETRSRAWWHGAIRRRLFAIGEDQGPVPARGERKWLVAYAPLAWICRIYLGSLIAAWVGARSPLLGLAIAALVGFFLLLLPVTGLVRDVTRSIDEPKRRRALRITGIATGALASAALLVPVPQHLVAPAVLWLPEQAQLRVEVEGVVQQLQARDGEQVAPGQLLASVEDPILLARQAETTSRRAGLQVRYFHALQKDTVRAQSLLQALDHADAEIKRIDTRVSQLQVRSQAAGRLVLLREQDLPGSYLKNGQMLGYVLAPGAAIVRAVVAHEDASLVLERSRSADVWFEERPGRTLRGDVRREAPAASHKLPSAALADRTGGTIPTDPADSDSLRTLQPVFAIDVALADSPLERIGGRAWVRFNLGAEALALQWTRAVRQLLLKHFAAA